MGDIKSKVQQSRDEKPGVRAVGGRWEGDGQTDFIRIMEEANCDGVDIRNSKYVDCSAQHQKHHM